jgi:hypothetical protein
MPFRLVAVHGREECAANSRTQASSCGELRRASVTSAGGCADFWSGSETWRQLRALNQLGVTRGTLQLL